MLLDGLPRLVNPWVQLDALPSQVLSKQNAKRHEGSGNSEKTSLPMTMTSTAVRALAVTPRG